MPELEEEPAPSACVVPLPCLLINVWSAKESSVAVREAARRAAVTGSVFTHPVGAPCRTAACASSPLQRSETSPLPDLLHRRFPAVSHTGG